MCIAGLISSVLAMVMVAQDSMPIQWETDLAAAVARSERMKAPLLIYVAGSNDDEGDEIEDAQQAVFRDPTISRIAMTYFVPTRISRTTQTVEWLRKKNLPLSYGMYAAITTSKGEIIERVNPLEAASPDVFAANLIKAFRAHRSQVFEQHVLPVLVDEAAKPAAIKDALDLVKRQMMPQADEPLIKLLQRERITPPLKKQVYELLAELATAPAVDALLTAAATDQMAREALFKAPVGALEHLLPRLDDRTAPNYYLAYEAIARISKLSAPKGAGFWTAEDNKRAQDEEYERVHKRVDELLKNWKERIAPFR